MTAWWAAIVGACVGGLIGTLALMFRAMAQREGVRAFERGEVDDPYAWWRGEDPGVRP